MELAKKKKKKKEAMKHQSSSIHYNKHISVVKIEHRRKQRLSTPYHKARN